MSLSVPAKKPPLKLSPQPPSKQRQCIVEVEPELNSDNGKKPREVVTCKLCGLRQYLIAAKRCRRCKTVFIIQPEMLAGTQVSAEAHTSENLAVDIAQNGNVARDVGHRIRELREAKGMLQKTFSDHARVSHGYLCRIEWGKSIPSLGTLEKLAEALGVEMKTLLAPRLEFERWNHRNPY